MANQQINQLRELIANIDQAIIRYDNKNKVQRDLFAEYTRIFNDFSQKLAILSNKINEQVLIDEATSNDGVCNMFQHLSNSLLRMADCSRNVAIKTKNQIYDPMNLFCENYNNLNQEQIRHLKAIECDLNEKMHELNKNKDNYLNAEQKLEKHKKNGNRMMTRIQSGGDIAELEKFNNSIKRITQNINVCRQTYKKSIAHTNMGYESMRKQIYQILKALTHNQQSRVSFTKKSVISSIRNLHDLTSFYDSGIEKKLEDACKMFEEKIYPYFNRSLELKIRILCTSTFKEQFVSYQQLTKLKRKKNNEEENPHLTEIFKQVKESDKQTISEVISPWFVQKEPGNEQHLKQNKKKLDEEVLNECKEKIVKLLPYSYYYIEQIFENINNMTSFYCKLADENFTFLLSSFLQISKILQFQSNTNSAEISIEFLYKMMYISTRIISKKSVTTSQPIDLLCYHFGKNIKRIYNQKVLKKLLGFIQKRKCTKKQTDSEQQSKGMMNSFTKNLYAVVKGKKQVQLNNQQLFVCYQELTHLMANLLVPTEVSIPFLHFILGKNENNRSFQYLKSILFEKKDQEERQKIFYLKEIKQKKQEKIQNAIENNRVAEYCFNIVAKRGFLAKQEINIRLVSKELTNIHKQILVRLPDIPNKWIRLIPYDSKLNYHKMKEQIAENRMAPHLEEIIILDVNRSLHNHSEYLSQQTLTNLLRMYGYFHKQISYCQGMNYIAGYLYIKTRNEEDAYRIFQYLMQSRFKQVFVKEFEVLKVKMYQFERLLSIFFPAISEHFKKQGITPECYIVSWIITLFASNYQYTQQSYLIDLLWERFIVWGWAQFFKFVLALFNFFKQELIELTYDKALHFLGQMGKSQMFLSSKEDFMKEHKEKRIEESLEQYPISEELLQSLEKEYKLI